MTRRRSVAPSADTPLSVLVPPDSRLVVVSPHLDDAVLSCGDLIAQHPGTVVVTAFAGRPAEYPALTSWDERAGFEPGADVVSARRQEDAAALATLGAEPHWLDFPDPQYGPKPARRELAEALARALAEHAPNAVVTPLGLFHDDHTLTSDALLELWPGPQAASWLVYADAIYRRVSGLLGERLDRLRLAGFVMSELRGSIGRASERKRRAVGCYASQVRALTRSWDGGVSDAWEPEQYWRILAAEQKSSGASAAARARVEVSDGDGP